LFKATEASSTNAIVTCDDSPVLEVEANPMLLDFDSIEVA
jgi:hypothetical protein